MYLSCIMPRRPEEEIWDASHCARCTLNHNNPLGFQPLLLGGSILKPRNAQGLLGADGEAWRHSALRGQPAPRSQGGQALLAADARDIAGSSWSRASPGVPILTCRPCGKQRGQTPASQLYLLSLAARASSILPLCEA